MECNTYECSFDSLECTYQMRPYQNCSVIRQGVRCYELFNNSRCDKACNTEDCLYDGFDCFPPPKQCNRNYEKYCSEHFADGDCDKGCNTVECDWDGGDCVGGDSDSDDVAADGVLILILLIPPEDFPNVRATLLRELIRLLRTKVWILRDDDGKEMIYPWPDSSRSRRSLSWSLAVSREKREIRG